MGTSRRFDGGLWDRECIHGFAERSWCAICMHPKPKVIVPRIKPFGRNEPDPNPPCVECGKKARKALGHVNHRRYVKQYAKRPVRKDWALAGTSAPAAPVTWKLEVVGYNQERAVWRASHQDDKGKWVCDQCCHGRCARCKSVDPWAPSINVKALPTLLAEDMLDRSEARITLLAEGNFMSSPGGIMS